MKPGRKSAADLKVVVSGKFSERPGPPSELTESQAKIGQAVVSSEPSDFFQTEALRGILGDYCRHRDSAAQVSEVISTFKPEWLKSEEGAKRYHGLLRMRELETRAALSCATKLRLTNQSRYTPQAANTASKNMATAPKPWET